MIQEKWDIVRMNGLNYRTPLPLSMVPFLGTVRPNCTITNIQINRFCADSSWHIDATILIRRFYQELAIVTKVMYICSIHTLHVGFKLTQFIHFGLAVQNW